MNKIRILNGNMLKIIAAIAMVIDHVGFMFFPDNITLRIIGRIAFPIFAFMIAEGAKYTKNKLKYFLQIFVLGFICQVVYYFFDDHSLYMSILITFSLSIILIYLLQYLKQFIFNTNKKTIFKIILPITIIPTVIISLWFLTKNVQIDYGFWGILTPVFASLFDFKKLNVPNFLKKLDCYYVRLLAFFVPLFFLMIYGFEFQWGWIFAIPFLLLYNERRGIFKMKYFFYLFYPIHLVVLEGIYMLIYYF